MHRFFAATGRFAVRFRWAVVAAWVAATVLASLLLPSLASVIKVNNTDQLPASSPSVSDARLATPFQDPNQTPVLVVIARDGGTVTPADITAIGRLAARLAKVADVQQVKDLGEKHLKNVARPIRAYALTADASGQPPLAAGLAVGAAKSIATHRKLVVGVGAGRGLMKN